MLSGAPIALTRRPIVSGSQRDRIDAIGAGGEIGPAARDRLVEPAVFVADILDVEIDARIDDDRNAGAEGSLTRRADPGSGVLQTADRQAARLHLSGAQAVLEVHPDRTGTDNVADRAADRLGRVAIPRFDIGGDRHGDGPGDARGGGHHLVPGSRFPVGVAERPGNPAAGCRDRMKTGSDDDPGADRIPRIGQQQEARPVMHRAKQPGLDRLFDPAHDAPRGNRSADNIRAQTGQRQA